MENRTISRADYVFETLENDILCGCFQPGDVLTELKICERLEVSRTPVREALKRLKQEGLVEESGHSVTVVGISEDDLRDIFEVRLRVEGYVARLCAGRMTAEELAQLREVTDLQVFYTARGGAAGIRDMDSRFHELMYQFCGSHVLRDMLTMLHHKIQRFRKMSVENPRRAEQAVREHLDILAALERRDENEAERLTVLHVRNAMNSTLSAAEKQTDRERSGG